MTVQDYLQDTFHIDENWFKNHPIPKRDLATISKADTVKQRMDFNMKFFKISPYELGIMIKQDAVLLSLEPDNIESKVNGYAKLLGLSIDDVKKLIVNSPKLLHDDVKGKSPTSIKSKIDFYKKALDASEDAVVKMVVACPTILDLDVVTDGPTSVKTKLKYLKQIATKDQIVANPKLLTFPARKIKIRFLILSSVFPKQKILQGHNLMTNENTMWARLCYIQKLDDRNYNFITASKTNFENKFGVKNQMLLKTYPITKDVVKKLEINYSILSNSSLELDEEELEDLGLEG